ncbi:hypothetical protein N7470_001033 [Penicillium chermesinum]|nr:hypothetical protein N7470_001033 [Penicillium chermesinum]
MRNFISNDYVFTDRGGVIENRHSGHATDLALMCASHSSEDRHIRRARTILARAGSEKSDLRCGGPIAQGCGDDSSSESAGEAEGCYLPEHPVQLRVRRVVEEVAGLTDGEGVWSVDGSNLPALGFALHRLAGMYARFADAGMREGERERAMLGADGCYGIGVRASRRTEELGAEEGQGIAVKIEDGNIGALYAAVAEILEQLGIGSAEEAAGRVSLSGDSQYGGCGGGEKHHFKIRPVD